MYSEEVKKVLSLILLLAVNIECSDFPSFFFFFFSFFFLFLLLFFFFVFLLLFLFCFLMPTFRTFEIESSPTLRKEITLQVRSLCP